MTEPLEQGYRDDLAADVHDVDDRRHQVAVDFPADGPPDKFGTSWGSGCFAASFRHQLPPMLVEHDRSRLVGHAISGQSVGRVHRLVGAFSDFDDVPLARETFAHIRDGDYPGWSFHFTEGETVPHPTVRSARRFTKATMKEFGPTVAPAIDGVLVSGLRSVLRADVDTADVYDRMRALLGIAKREKGADHAHVAALENSVVELARQMHLERLGAPNTADKLAEDLSGAYGDALEKLADGASTRSVLEDAWHIVEQDALARRREADPSFASAERGNAIADDIRRLAALRLGRGTSGRRSYSTAVVDHAWIRSLVRADRQGALDAVIARLDQRGPRGPKGSAA
jgi:hypothetical protein